MVIGLLLMVLGALAVVAAVFTATGESVEVLGFDVTAVGLYLFGLGSGVAILWGFTISKWGTKRTLRQRREARKLDELQAKLDQREAEQRTDEGSGDRSV
ncbi:hypothetical protein GON03_13900 [Nocardioides sp. MAH-18]|uniref:Uncharacterized protein n=1 Tax=Nocardioides agri TaxID=2682843 RepID=A0A6L6XUV3_9ACTN|nr:MULTISPECIES: hypothetical protein [unclassified Nocardioides]MBA2955426.1 hypothetical protein [Nocardioides sp. CGMCC 1.13656]MVQ50276.1 hypothetical protein [Nocardioides sp. MAH-18]